MTAKRTWGKIWRHGGNKTWRQDRTIHWREQRGDTEYKEMLTREWLQTPGEVQRGTAGTGNMRENTEEGRTDDSRTTQIHTNPLIEFFNCRYIPSSKKIIFVGAEIYHKMTLWRLLKHLFNGCVEKFWSNSFKIFKAQKDGDNKKKVKINETAVKRGIKIDKFTPIVKIQWQVMFYS